ncbi:MAG: flagellar M-ring protein FliF C-terminal domain-containing protein, partial [Pseudomonadota bacterium]
DSRIERSVQIVREAGKTENKETDSPTTIDQNLPEEDVGGNARQSSSENSERREELMNYEINEKKVSLVSDGYNVENLSVAILINKGRISEILGPAAATNEFEEKAAELQQIVSAAVSLSPERGDKVTVNLVEFIPETDVTSHAEGNVALSFLAVHFGSILNTAGLILAAVLFALLGIRPVIAFLNKNPASAPVQAQLPAGNVPGALPAGSDTSVTASLPDPATSPADPLTPGATGAQSNNVKFSSSEPLVDATQMAEQESRITQQLEHLVAQSQERSAIAIKHWMQNDNAPAV